MREKHQNEKDKLIGCILLMTPPGGDQTCNKVRALGGESNL